MKGKFTPEERRVLSVLYMAQKPLTTFAVSEQAEMAWQTAKKYLERLRKAGYVSRGKYGKSVYWWLKV
jgi:Mn-dependent DtxR family transcriptional regulator